MAQLQASLTAEPSSASPQIFLMRLNYTLKIVNEKKFVLWVFITIKKKKEGYSRENDMGSEPRELFTVFLVHGQ